jgi:hypothetical protein
MSSINRDWISMKFRPEVTCQLNNLIYVGDQKPCAHFLASNIYEWGLLWETDADGQTRIPLQILIPDDDQVDGGTRRIGNPEASCNIRAFDCE